MCSKKEENIAILGASKGLGYSLKGLVEKRSSSKLFLSSRTKIETSKNSKWFFCDFSKPDSLTDLKDHLIRFEPDRIFFTAGGGPYGAFTSKEFKDHKWAFEVNLFSPIHLIHFLSVNLKKNFQFVLVGSAISENSLGFEGLSYHVSKKALKHFHEEFQKEELNNIDLRLFSPSYMDTSLLPKGAKPRLEKNISSPIKIASQLWEWAQDTSQKNKHLTLNVE